MIFFPILSGVALSIVTIGLIMRGEGAMALYAGMAAFWSFACASTAAAMKASKAKHRILLALLTDAPDLGGYTLSQLADVSPGAVYVCLDRLENDGWIVGDWETPEPLDRPRRRFYQLTPEGRANALEFLKLHELPGRQS